MYHTFDYDKLYKILFIGATEKLASLFEKCDTKKSGDASSPFHILDLKINESTVRLHLYSTSPIEKKSPFTYIYHEDEYTGTHAKVYILNANTGDKNFVKSPKNLGMLETFKSDKAPSRSVNCLWALSDQKLSPKKEKTLKTLQITHQIYGPSSSVSADDPQAFLESMKIIVNAVDQNSPHDQARQKLSSVVTACIEQALSNYCDTNRIVLKKNQSCITAEKHSELTKLLTFCLTQNKVSPQQVDFFKTALSDRIQDFLKPIPFDYLWFSTNHYATFNMPLDEMEKKVTELLLNISKQKAAKTILSLARLLISG